MKEIINDWVFHFNPYTKRWSATKRETYYEMFNDIKSKNVIHSSKIEVLIDLINITNGDIVKMNKLVK